MAIAASLLALLVSLAAEHPLAGGQEHRHRPPSEDALIVVVDQLGIDVEVQWQATGQPARRADGASDRWGREVLVVEPASTGELIVRAVSPHAATARYRLTWLPLAAAGAGADALRALGNAGELAAAGRSTAAREAFASAVAGFRACGEARWQLEALRGLAAQQREPDTARGTLLDALRLTEGHGPGLEAYAATLSNSLALRQLELGDREAALAALERAESLYAGLDDAVGAVIVGINRCFVEGRLGALPVARGCYETLLPALERLGDAPLTATVLNNLGGIEDALGEPDAARAHLEAALAMRHHLGDAAGEAQSAINLAVAHRRTGEWTAALALYGQARELLELQNDQAGLGSLLNNLGFAYLSVGEPERARGLFEASLSHRRASGDRRGAAISWNNLGLAHRALDAFDAAEAAHREALALALALDDRRQEAVARLRLAELSLERGATKAVAERVLPEAERALELSRAAGNRRGQGDAATLRGRALLALDRAEEAAGDLGAAAALRAGFGDRAGEAESRTQLSVAQQALGRADAARDSVARAMAAVESLRAGLSSTERRVSFLATQQRVYRRAIELAMARHRAEPGARWDLEALTLAERSRARGLIELLAESTAWGQGVQGPGDRLARRDELYRRLHAKADRRLQLAERGDDTEAESLGREVEAIAVELETLEASIGSERTATSSTLNATQLSALLDAQTVLLELSLGEPESYLWVVRRQDIETYVLPPRSELTTLASTAARELSHVTHGRSPALAAAHELSRRLLSPAWREAGPAMRLEIVPEGALLGLAWAALPVPAPGGNWTDGPFEPLLRSREIVLLPSASSLAALRERPSGTPTRWAAVFADPRLGRGFDPLPATRREAEAIVASSPAGGTLTLLGEEASRAAVLAAPLADFRFLHFATHAHLDSRFPELSGLVLSSTPGRSEPELLRLADLTRLQLRSELVVLSGCETALGREAAGEGLLGLARGFLGAGAGGVVASLWRVEDRATAELMAEFYDALAAGEPPARALRSAQLAVAADRRFRHPYYWAGWVLIGEGAASNQLRERMR